jgi:rhodanese-related sulfurtransferase
VHTLWEQRGAVFLDAREHGDVEDYFMDHLPGAYDVPYSSFTTAFASVRPQLPPSVPLVVYGTDQPCDKGLRVARNLVAEGYRVYLLSGGFPAWKKAALPLQGGHNRGEVGVAP